MTKRIDEFVSENRRDIKKIDSTFIPISGQSDKNLSFSDNEFQINVSIEVYTRPLNQALVSGHPNGDTHGSGHGESGDDRGEWTLHDDFEVSAQFVVSGRDSVGEALAGTEGAVVQETAIGNGTNEAQVTDNSLQSEVSRSSAWKIETTGNESVVGSVFLFSETGSEVSEYGVYSGNDKLYNRITTQTNSISNEEEIRVETTFTVTGDGTGNSVITDTGEGKVAQSFVSGTPIGIDAFAFGSGSTSPSESDTSLAVPEFDKPAQQTASPEAITARTIVFEDEPQSQPITLSEIGVEDNNGDLLWRTTLEPFEKTDSFEFTATVGFRIK